jgi:hypothetical protein
MFESGTVLRCVRLFVCFFSLFSFIKNGRYSCKITFLSVFACVCVYHFFQIMKQLTDFDEIWYEHMPFERRPSVVRFNYLRLLTGTWRRANL